MKYIIAGTDRPDSNTLKVARYIQGIYKSMNEDVGIIDLRDVKAHLHLHTGPHYGKDNETEGIKEYLEQVKQADGLIVVCPEYNGSMPGVLKYFIDHFRFPESFEYRPVCFVGLGGIFGGLRPVEHLQQVFGYRNSFIYPERVFMMNVWKMITKEGDIQDDLVKSLLRQQADGFQKFTKALADHKLDANSRIAAKS